MPRGDRTGPMGQGPRTGKGMGPCGRGKTPQSGGQGGFFSRFGNKSRGSGNRGNGQGGGRAQGMGRGQGRGMNRFGN